MLAVSPFTTQLLILAQSKHFPALGMLQDPGVGDRHVLHRHFPPMGKIGVIPSSVGPFH